MKAIIMKPGKYGEAKDIDPTYNNLCNLVGGYIEMTYPFMEANLAVISNEESKLLDLSPNRAARWEDGTIADIYCGPMVVVGLDDDGEFRSLTDEEENLIMEKWGRPEDKDDWGGTKPNMSFCISGMRFGDAEA